MKNVFFAILSIAISMGLFLIPDIPITGDQIVLGADNYDMVVIDAPATKGPLLDFLSRMLSQSLFGPFIRRKLLNKNQVHMLRELSAQIELPPLHFPLYRMNKSEREEQQRLANAPESSIHTALQNGIGAEDKTILPSINDYARRYRSLEEKPSDVMKRTIAAVRAWEKEGFLIFSSLIEEDILAQAYESDARHAAGQPLSIFDGVPVAIKDLIEVEGHVIYDGQKPNISTAGELSSKDDIVTSRLRQVGAIIFGVTIMSEGGMSPLGYNTHFRGPTNAFSLHHYSGGSSSGSAVSVATGLVPVAIAFDEGGSIRMPAAQNAGHGLAGTFGRVPYGDAISTLTKCGPIANSAADVALTYAALASNQPGHFYDITYDGGILGIPEPHLRGFNNIEDLSDVRLGVFKEWFEDSDPDIRRLCQSAINFMVSRGAVVVPITIPHLQWMSLAHGIKIASEFASIWDHHLHTNPHHLEPNTRITLGIGSSVTALEVLSGEYLRAYGFEYIRKVFATYNLTTIATPMLPILSPPLTEDAKAFGESNTALSVQLMRYAFLANFLGLPAYSVPVGFASPQENGNVKLPVGLQLIGNHWQEDKLIRLAHSVEQGYTNKLNRPSTIFSFRPFEK